MRFVGEGSSAGPSKPLFTTREEDVEFKKLLWTGVLYVSRDPANHEAHEVLVARDVVSALLAYLDPSSPALSAHRWQPPQLNELQIHGLSVLSNVISLVLEHLH